MKRPLNKEVSRVLTEKKLFHSELNNVNTKNWNESHYNEWEFILTGVKKAEKDKDKPRHNPHRKVKVMRLTDGYIFESIGECIKQEGIHQLALRNFIKQEINYKKVI
jgi:hypothetical protein